MKANIFIRDTKLVETSGGATIRYSNPKQETYGIVKDLLEGFDEIEIFTDRFLPSDLSLINYFIIEGYKVKLSFTNNNINYIKEF